MKFKKWLDEETTTGAIALNLAKGGGQGPGVDVIGASCPDGQKWDKKKGKCVESKLSESKDPRLKGIPKEFINDPLYKNVLTAKSQKEYVASLDTLSKIRGRGAVKALKKAIVAGSKPTSKLAKQFTKVYGVSEYDETHRGDIYQDLAKEIMKKHKGKKVIPAQVVQDAVVGHWAGDAPYDKYDYQEIADILKKKGIKLKGGIR